MWKLTEHKSPSGEQEIKVKILLKEMAAESYAWDAESFERKFILCLKELPRRNNFSADLMYKVTHRNTKSVEVWKLTASGDFKHKMWTLDYVTN